MLFLFWSGLRGSNPPPSPWQGDALPNELNPHIGKWSKHNVNSLKPKFLDDFCAWHSKQGKTLQVGKVRKALKSRLWNTLWLLRLPIWCLRSESNQRHGDFQSPALPTELQRLIKQGLLIYKWRPEGDSNPWPLAWQASVLTNWTTGPNGGNNRARTYDPLLVRQMLSQLSYAPIYLSFRQLHYYTTPFW